MEDLATFPPVQPLTMASELVHESHNSRLFIHENAEFGKHLIKILNEEYPSPHAVKYFYNEFEIVKDLALVEGVRKVLASGKFNNRYSLHLEYIDAITLREFKERKPDLPSCLRIGIKLAGILDQIHRKNIIHKDLSPGNVLVNPHSLDVYLIDFGISSRFTLKKKHLGNPEKLEGTLSYVSPEQTGRMNRFVDYRTDLYSMGIILYELITGKLPFDAKDAMGLVHAHIAGTIVPPHQIRESIPKAISDIILKLTSKNAEDRYQSAQGLRTDLEKCLLSLQRSGKINEFTLAEDDFSGKFQLNQKLYGREQEIETLLKAFDRVGDHHIELILVAGYSGTGKSSLVHEIHKPITQRRGYFIEGKFDQFQRAVPYFAILQAFKNLIHLILTEDERKLDTFRNGIQKALGGEGKVLTDVLPDLELIIGEQPHVAEIAASDARNRFNYIFRKFVQSICTEQHPITMFIDDLQWADSSSLDLLSVLLTDPELGNFLCICAYRDNEVSTTHPFTICVEGMRGQGVVIHTIGIDNLSRQDVNALIADSLAMDHGKTMQLTELVYEKTGGNAFFVTQFLYSLYEERLLHFDLAIREWRWDIGEIKGHNLPDDVVVLMAGKVQRLPDATQDILKLASCIGAGFDLETLTVISGLSAEDCINALQSALAEGLILTEESNYRFAHDRIQQAVYSLIPIEDKSALHLRIGRLLREKYQGEVYGERLFDIVNQLNRGIHILEADEEREQLSKLNLTAARKAKETSAFELGFGYAHHGINLLKKDHWESQRALSIELFNEAAETAFLSSKFDEMNQYIDTTLRHAASMEEQIKPYEIRIQSLKAENKLPVALSVGLELLGKLGEKFPANPTPIKVMPDLLKTVRLLYGKSNEKIRDLPENTNEIKRAAIRVCASIAPSSYWAKPDIFPFIIFRIIRLSIVHGNTAVSAFGYATFGVIMVGVFNFIETAVRYGKLGLLVMDKFNAKEWIAQIYTPVYALIIIWNQHVKNTLKPLQESYHIGLETGAIEFACINANIYCIHAYLIGRPLEKLEEEIRDYSANFLRFKQCTNWEYNEVYRQAALNFMGQSADPLLLSGTAYDEVTMLQANLERKNRISVFFIYFNKLILFNYFGKYQDALNIAHQARPLLDAVLAKLEVAYLHFHEALAAIAIMHSVKPAESRKLKARVRSNMKKMKKWARHAPENFLHKYELLLAQLARFEKRHTDAQDAFERAIRHAGEHGYLHEEALSYELAGEFYRERGNMSLAAYHLKSAFQVYRDWGANAKMQDLQRKYPDIITSVTQGRTAKSGASQGSFQPTITTTTLVEDSTMDLATVLKASASISGEIVLDKLLGKLMDILMENLGATRGVLMLESEGQLFVEIQSGVDGISADRIPALDSGLFPESLIVFVRRTQGQVVIQNGTTDTRYSNDPYVKTHKPLSILCYPIMHKGSLIGLAYFENNLAEAAFTIERIELLSLLSGQIAISIENALLYENLEQKVEDRTAELNAEKIKSDALLLNILPQAAAEELKKYGRTTPQRFEHVTVMFTDFVDFTRISAGMNPTALVDELGTYFAEFDRIMDKYGLEKIKTIGDSYMCAGGLPIPDPDHAIHVIGAAIEIRDYMLHIKEEKDRIGMRHFGIRTGIHSGPVVAGVVGLKKFAYDIWGDTVNTASRMESHCEPWKINISGDTLTHVKHLVDYTHRGKIDAKSKGQIDMYFVNSILS